MELKLELLSQDDLARIHAASIKLLKETGCVFQDEDALATFKKHGARVEGSTVHFSEPMIEKAMATVPRTFKWRARNHAFSTTIGGDGFRLGPNAGNIYVQDLDNGRRLAELADVRKIQTIHQLSDVTDFVGGNPCDPHDIDPLKKHLHITYETLKHTDKPLVSYFGPYEGQADEILKMVKIAFGEENLFNNHHVIGLSTPPESPLCYPQSPLWSITEFAKHRQPVMISVAIMGGITGPIDLIGVTLLQNAELLAISTYIQLVHPGAPVVWAPSSTMGWLKTANYNTGTPEGMLPNIAGLQMAKDFYHVPTRSMAGLTDSKSVDCQAGYETMQNLLLAMLGGAQFIYEALGVLDGILTTSYEKIIIDEELYLRAKRICEGMDTSPDALKSSLNLIKEVGCRGEYLSHQTTFEKMHERWKPMVSDWNKYDDSIVDGAKRAENIANSIWKERVAQAPASYLDSALDKDLLAFIEAHS